MIIRPALESDVIKAPHDLREQMFKLENAMLESGAKYGDQDFCPLRHSFADGCYVREIFNPKGALIVTKIHKVAHPFFLLKGDMSILTEEGVVRIKAPFYGITPAGTKRVIYAHEDIVFVTVHVTEETDLEKIEGQIIAKSFDELPRPEEVEALVGSKEV